jgi:uncharacterized YccA/Bax inhibitor family protein
MNSLTLAVIGATLAVISGEALVNAVLWIVIGGIICGLLYWLIGACKTPEPWRQVAVAVISIASVLILINAVLTLVGHPIIKW